ncbi:hypothetical protein CDAR_386601 [Caerostris darwini]|uniref:K Homology domain-containing protein n=1 Tax=Caerostris darwini TaxID=1538125 RepID=A0AAV4X949_9ARAC|nr:hypothetical protein CDAR_386601 [Caerostris darwini]
MEKKGERFKGSSNITTHRRRRRQQQADGGRDVLYAKILTAGKDAEPELVCVNSYGKSVGYGVVPPDGYALNVSLDYCRRLLLPNSPILKRLGTVPYVIAIGVNGRIWIKSTTVDRTLVLVQVLSLLEYATSTEIEFMFLLYMLHNLWKFFT